jgi:PncC family amidohydrolase
MDPNIVHAALLKSKLTLSLAESCTGGKIAATLTAIPGASNFLLGSIVAYANDWKEKFLGVSPKTLATFGAVSPEVAEEMVKGLFSHTSCDLAAAVTGIAGTAGGAIYIATARRGQKIHIQQIKALALRQEAIDMAVQTTLKALLDLL